MGVSIEQGEQEKVRYGLAMDAPPREKEAAQKVANELMDKATALLNLYQQKTNRIIKKSVLIGGGANLRDLKAQWSKVTPDVAIGNPWKGLSYPEQLENTLTMVGPTYAVAVGLALRGLANT